MESAEADEPFTIEELEIGKPLMVYRFIDQLMEAGDDNYKFSQAFEVKILAKEKVVARINENWRAKKSPVDIEADRKKEENQAGVLFYSYTESKLGELGVKSSMSSRNFITALTKYEKKNKLLATKEIKRLEKLAADKDEDTASK